MKNKTLTLGILILLGAISSLLASNGQSDSLVSEAWQAWEQNDQRLVEQKFLAAIENDPNNARAALGLSFLYNLQKKYPESWMMFNRVLQNEEKPYPYIYSALLTSKFKENFDTPNSGIIDLLKNLGLTADSGNVLKAMATERLAEYYQEKGDLAKAKQYYLNLKSISDWLLIGPFENISACGFDKAYPPEFEFDTTHTYEGKNGVPAKWFSITAIPGNYWIDLCRYSAFDKSVFYANNFVYSPQKQAIQVRIGTSGSLKAFLNDEPVIQCADENNNDLDTYIVETELQQGWNRLLIKCGFSEIDRCNFMIRLTDDHGNPMNGLEITTAVKPYKSHPHAPVKIIENFAETFFQQKIKDNPGHLENYLLLADCYLRNDKAIEAELVLREAIKVSPNCALLHYHILEAYHRGEKYDDIATTMEKIYSLDKNIPVVIEYRVSDYLTKEELAKAREFIDHLEKLQPGAEKTDELNLAYFAARDQVEKVIELANLAYKKYPTNWVFCLLQAALTIQQTQKFDDAIKIYKKYLDKNYNKTTLLMLANAYLSSANLKKWQETYDKALQLDPADTEIYDSMTDTYIALQDYDNAEKTIKKALEICPNSPDYLAKLGEIYRISNNIALAKQCYRNALKYRPSDYDARDILRELEGKENIFSQFKTIDIDSLIKNSPVSELYPEDDAVILLNDAKRVVYEKGASEFRQEVLVKVFNNRGIDRFKEYWIGYNPFTQDLTVEKAVVHKKDGSEIKADVNVNLVVFKSLEQNDFIYLKWRIRNYYSGRVAGHFWDSFNFNSFYPMKIVRYALLVPQNSLQLKTQNMPNAPLQRQTRDGILYQWSVRNEPAIKHELGMPGLDDVGKMLYVSSIDNWEQLVEWYTDLAQTRTKSSFEIKERVKSLFKGKETCSEEEKIETIYNYITENIRYSYVPFRQSALVPQKARDVLVNNIGDCKDMATLCIAMLREVGIDAFYVLLNTKNNGRNLNVLPSIVFNHCIVAVATQNGLKYLDPTAYNYPAGSLPQHNVAAFSLLIKPGIGKPGSIPSENLLDNNIVRLSKVDIRQDNSIFVETLSTKTGELAASMRNSYRDKGEADVKKMLTGILSNDFPNVVLEKYDLKNLDSLKAMILYSYSYHVPDYLTEAGQYKFLQVPWAESLEPDPALSYDQRKYPYNFWPGADTLVQDIEIRLQTGYEPINLHKVSFSSSVADYTLSFTYSDGVIKGHRMLVYKKEVVTPEEYSEFKKFYNNVVKADEKQILLKEETKLVEK